LPGTFGDTELWNFSSILIHGAFSGTLMSGWHLGAMQLLLDEYRNFPKPRNQPTIEENPLFNGI